MKRLLLLALCACGYVAQQQKRSEAELDQHAVSSGEQEPGEVNTYAAPTYPGQPLQDRLRQQKKVGGKKWGHESWLDGKMGSDEHLEVKANVGPTGFASWIGWLVMIAGVLGVVGAVAWKLKPAWLGWLWAILKPKGPAIAQDDSGVPRIGPSA